MNDLVSGSSRASTGRARDRQVVAALAGGVPLARGHGHDDRGRPGVRGALRGPAERPADHGRGRLVLIFGAAVFAAFNLTSRIVEAKRRELGVGMALGQPRWSIAMRPMLMGLQIALLGVASGWASACSWPRPRQRHGLDAPDAGVPNPLPDWASSCRPRCSDCSFRSPRRYGRCGEPCASTSGRCDTDGAPGRQRGRSLAAAEAAHRAWEEPQPDAGSEHVRAPRRTMLTVVGLGAAICAMVGVIGAIDSFNATIDVGVQEVRSGRTRPPGGGPRRTSCPCRRAPCPRSPRHPVCGGGAVAPGGRPAARRSGDTADRCVRWSCSTSRTPCGTRPIQDAVDAGDLPGIVLAEKAAADLGVVPGDVVTVRHTVVEAGQTVYRSVDEPMRVVGVHPYPIRSFAYLDSAYAGRFGLAGAERGAGAPAPGADIQALKRALFEVPGVASVAARRRCRDRAAGPDGAVHGHPAVRRALRAVLALLIAFNAAAINVDERAREHATMFAFGVRPRAVLRGITVEGLVVGLLGTSSASGSACSPCAGSSPAPPPTCRTSAWSSRRSGHDRNSVPARRACGGVAPLFTFRRLRRMDVPSTLRVME